MNITDEVGAARCSYNLMDRKHIQFNKKKSTVENKQIKGLGARSQSPEICRKAMCVCIPKSGQLLQDDMK